MTYGYLVGEVVRRISGKSLGTFFADEVAGPLGLRAWIGLPEEQEEKVATIEYAAPFTLEEMTARNSRDHRAGRGDGQHLDDLGVG